MYYKMYWREPSPAAWKTGDPPNPWVHDGDAGSGGLPFITDWKMDRVFELRKDIMVKVFRGDNDSAPLQEETIMEWRYTSEDGLHVEEHTRHYNPEPDYDYPTPVIAIVVEGGNPYVFKNDAADFVEVEVVDRDTLTEQEEAENEALMAALTMKGVRFDITL